MDIVMPFIIEKGLFRGSLIAADQTITDMLDCHSYPPLVERIMSQAAVLALALAGSIKYEGVFSLQIRGNGPISTVFITVTHDKQLRGYCVYEADRLPDESETDNEVLFGSGQLLFSLAQIGKEPYQGVVMLTQKTLLETVKDYFEKSEQIKTELIIRQEGRYSRCLILQQMPIKSDVSVEQQADLWQTALVLLNSVKDSELFESKLPPEQVLYRLFHANDLVVFKGDEPTFFCPCHSSTMKRFLDKLTPAERESLYQEGKIITECQFCQKQYTFTQEDFK